MLSPSNPTQNWVESFHYNKKLEEQQNALIAFSYTVSRIQQTAIVNENQTNVGNKTLVQDDIHLNNQMDEEIKTDRFILKREFHEILGVMKDDMKKCYSILEANESQSNRDKQAVDLKIMDLISNTAQKEKPVRNDGKLVWRIPNVSNVFEKMINACDHSLESITSERFRTTSGHEFRLRIFLNGVGKGIGKSISLFVQMCRTELDATLMFPFKGVIEFTLYDQSDSGKKTHHVQKFRTNDSECFQRPVHTDFCLENGLAEFHPNKFLGEEDDQKTPCYLKNDTIFIGVAIN